MSKPRWQASLRQALRRRNNAPRVAIVGIGHDFNGDDAAGLVVVRTLERVLGARDRLLILDAGPAPENTTGRLRSFAPDLVLLIDAAQMDAPPGAIRWLDWQQTTGISASTHTLPLHLLARYLVAELGCNVALLGIQPVRNAVDAPLSRVVQEAAEAVAAGLAAALFGVSTPVV